jgi:hypothetical protein
MPSEACLTFRDAANLNNECRASLAKEKRLSRPRHRQRQKNTLAIIGFMDGLLKAVGKLTTPVTTGSRSSNARSITGGFICA